MLVFHFPVLLFQTLSVNLGLQNLINKRQNVGVLTLYTMPRSHTCLWMIPRCLHRCYTHRVYRNVLHHTHTARKTTYRFHWNNSRCWESVDAKHKHNIKIKYNTAQTLEKLHNDTSSKCQVCPLILCSHFRCTQIMHCASYVGLFGTRWQQTYQVNALFLVMYACSEQPCKMLPPNVPKPPIDPVFWTWFIILCQTLH